MSLYLNVIAEYSGHGHTIESFDIAMERIFVPKVSELDKCINSLLVIAARIRNIKEIKLCTFFPSIILLETRCASINKLFSIIVEKKNKSIIQEALAHYRTYVMIEPEIPGKIQADNLIRFLSEI